MWIFTTVLVVWAVASADGGVLTGVVRDSRTGEPMARVAVQLAGAGKQALTGADGSFDFGEVAPGEYSLRASTVGYRLLQTRITLEAGDRKALEVSLTPDSFQATERIEVRADPFDLARALGPTDFAIEGSEAKNLASVLADDPLRAVQSMPGVSANDDFDSRFSLHGAPYTKGRAVPGRHPAAHAVSHGAGRRAFGLAHGVQRGHGRPHDARDRGLRRAVRRPHGRGSGRAHARRQPVANERAADGRRGGCGRAGGGAAGAEGLVAGERAAELFAVPRQTIGGRAGDGVRVPGFTGGGDLRAGAGAHAAAEDDRRDVRLRPDGSAGPAGAQHVDAGAVSLLAGERRVGVRADGRVRDDHACGVPAGALRRYEPERERVGRGLLRRVGGEDERRVDVEPVWRAGLRGVGAAGAGGRIRRLLLRHGQPHAGGRVSGRRGAGGRARATVVERTGKAAVHHGGRAVGRARGGVSPQASIAILPWRSTRVQISWGQYAQAPDVQSLDSAYGSPRLLPERATHVAAAVEQRLGPMTRLRVAVYRRNDRDLLFRPGLEARLAGGAIVPDQFQAPIGNSMSGYAEGAEFFLQRRTANRLTGWVSYALGWTRMRDGVTGARFVADQDQRHTVNVYLGYRARPSVNVSGRWTYGSGFPRAGLLSAIG